MHLPTTPGSGNHAFQQIELHRGDLPVVKGLQALLVITVALQRHAAGIGAGARPQGCVPPLLQCDLHTLRYLFHQLQVVRGRRLPDRFTRQGGKLPGLDNRVQRGCRHQAGQGRFLTALHKIADLPADPGQGRRSHWLYLNHQRTGRAQALAHIQRGKSQQPVALGRGIQQLFEALAQCVQAGKALKAARQPEQEQVGAVGPAQQGTRPQHKTAAIARQKQLAGLHRRRQTQKNRPQTLGFKLADFTRLPGARQAGGKHLAQGGL